MECLGRHRPSLIKRCEDSPCSRCRRRRAPPASGGHSASGSSSCGRVAGPPHMLNQFAHARRPMRTLRISLTAGALTATCTYRYPIVPSSDASGAGTFIDMNGVARGSVENFGNPIACAISPAASSSEYTTAVTMDTGRKCASILSCSTSAVRCAGTGVVAKGSY
jgi:hypothetical protein